MTEIPSQNPGELTQLLIAWGDGDEQALEKLAPMVYDELRRIASRSMKRERPGHTLQTTALIHETFLRLIGRPQERWRNRAHFYGIAAQMMRRILVDFARTRLRAKRGGDAIRIDLEKAESQAVSAALDPDLLALDAALAELQQMDPRRARVIELRFFLGLEVEEAAKILAVSPDTVIRDWRVAKAWLYRRLQDGN
jgi:RNA polymerase sigma-70 factor, ECF subfamily